MRTKVCNLVITRFYLILPNRSDYQAVAFNKIEMNCIELGWYNPSGVT